MKIKPYRTLTKWERKERLWVIWSIVAYVGFCILCLVLSQVN